MAGRRVDCGRWNRCGWSLIASGNWSIDSADRNEIDEETGFSCGLESRQRRQERGRRKPGSAADW